MTQEGVTSGIT